MTQWHGGKGSGRRKAQNDKKYADNFDSINWGETDVPEPEDEVEVSDSEETPEENS